MSNCGDLLIPDTTFVHKDVSTSLSYLSTIDSSSYQQHKTNASNGITFPFADVLLNNSTSYSDFDEKRADLFKQYGFDYNFKDSSLYYTRSVSAQAHKAFQACINSYGLQIRVSNVSATEVELEVGWNNFPGHSDTPNFVMANLIGGTLITTQNALPARLAVNSKYTLTFQREASKDFRLSANVGATTDSVFVPRWLENKPISTLQSMQAINVQSNAWVPMVIEANKPTTIRITGKWFNHMPNSMLTAAQGIQIKYRGIDGKERIEDNDMLPHLVGIGESAWVACTDPVLSDNDTFWEDIAWESKFKEIYDHGPVRYYVWN